MALDILRRLRCTSICTTVGEIKLANLEAGIPVLLQDLKVADVLRVTSLTKLSSLARFLTPAQKLDILPLLLPIVQNYVNLPLPALTLLAELIDSSTIKKISTDGWLNLLFQVVASQEQHRASLRNVAFRCLCRFANLKFSRKSIGTEVGLARITAELAQPGGASSYAVQLFAYLVEDPQIALLTRNSIVPLVGFLRATSAVKYRLPALRALGSMSRHDDRTLRSVIEAGVIPLLAELIRSPPHIFHQQVPTEASLLLCEISGTKNVEIQDLLVLHNVGSSLRGCLTSNNTDVKRSAIIAVERWMYSDDRMINFSIEFFSRLSESDVHISQRFKALLAQFQAPPSQAVKSPPVMSLIAEIKGVKEADEMKRLHQEIGLLRSRLTSEEKRAQTYENVAKQFPTAPPPVPTPPPPAKPPSVEELISSTKDIKDLEVMEKLLAEKKKELHNKELENLKDWAVCNICLDNKKNAALNPCGHTFCEACAKKIFSLAVHQRKCPACRHVIVSVSKLYF